MEFQGHVYIVPNKPLQEFCCGDSSKDGWRGLWQSVEMSVLMSSTSACWSVWTNCFARSSLSRPTSKRTLKTSKPTFLRIATGRANHPLRSHRSKILVAVCSVRYIHVPGIPFKQGPKRLLVLTPFSVAGAAGGTLFFSWLIATAEYLLQSGFVSSRHFLCCVPKNLCVSELSPCPSPSQHIFWRLNHAGQNILQEGIRQSKLGMCQSEERL